MSAVFVEPSAAGGHLRIPCADLGRPAVTLIGNSGLPPEPCARRKDTAASTRRRSSQPAIAEQRRVLAEAQASSKLASGVTSARLPEAGSKEVAALRPPPASRETEGPDAWRP